MRDVKQKKRNIAISEWDWRMGVVVGMLLILAVSLFVSLRRSSVIWGGAYRYNLIVASESGKVEFLSFDPVDKEVLEIVWPANLSIKSRSVGSYQVGDLYKLGAYESTGGELVRRKVQGFMRIPVMGYIVCDVEEVRPSTMLLSAIWRGEEASSISRLDSAILWWRYQSYRRRNEGVEELVRAGVMQEEEGKYLYQPGRLQQFLGQHVFDWGVGEEKLTVVIINESGEKGLATDVANFFSNVGMDVVAVRNGSSDMEKTVILLSESDPERNEKVVNILSGWFGWNEYGEVDISEYRAEVVVKLGKDAEELF